MILTRAPLRITLGGGGTDLASYYSRYGGFVLSAAIDKYVYVSIHRPAIDDLIRLKYSRFEEVATVDEVQHDLVRPALRLLGVTKNVEIASLADVPTGTGLGSSSSYMVAVLAALYALRGERLPPTELAELAYLVEHDMAGHPVGKQDQYLAALGGITSLEFGTDGSVQVELLGLPAATRIALRERLLLFYTAIVREHHGILSRQIAETDSAAPVTLESLHRTKAIGREARRALESGDLDSFGLLMHEHWETKKRRASDVSAEPIDRQYALAREAGALGGKIVGAGGAGFLMLYVPPTCAADVRAAMAAESLHEMRYDFEFEGVKVLLTD